MALLNLKFCIIDGKSIDVHCWRNFWCDDFLVVMLSLLTYSSVVVINRCVPSFLIDVLEKGKNLATEISNSNANATDANGNPYNSAVMEGGLRWIWINWCYKMLMLTLFNILKSNYYTGIFSFKVCMEPSWKPKNMGRKSLRMLSQPGGWF